MQYIRITNDGINAITNLDLDNTSVKVLLVLAENRRNDTLTTNDLIRLFRISDIGYYTPFIDEKYIIRPLVDLILAGYVTKG